MQRSACGLLHPAGERFANWLLLLSDRVRTDEVAFTHERMAYHVGLRRAGVTVLCQELANTGAIGNTRGRIRFLDRRALEQSACECFNAMIAEDEAGRALTLSTITRSPFLSSLKHFRA